MHRHVETFLAPADLGVVIPPYRPTYPQAGPFLNSRHAALASCPVRDGVLIEMRTRRFFGRRIEGWLRREDALKLYELAFCAEGEILELGSYHGLSTSILSQANHDSGLRKRLVTVDLDAANVRTTNRTLRARGLLRGAELICGEGAATVRALAEAGRRFAFVFIDHAHAYAPVLGVCRELHRAVTPGGFCLFHDFNDVRNRDGADPDYGVYQAVLAGLDPDAFQFWGIYGCAGLYRRIGGA